MSETEYARTEVTDAGIGTVTLMNSKALNILGSPAIDALTNALTALAARDDIRVLVVRGAGERAFIGGADIHEMIKLDQPWAEAFIMRLRDLCEAVRRFPTPVIARLSGWTLGGGLEVAAACDLRVAAEGAQFGMPEVAVGIPSVIHAALLPRLIGTARATWLILTGESIDAATALQWGLVHQVVAPHEIDSRIAALAGRLAAFGSQVLRQQKRMLREWETLPLDTAIEASIAEFGRAYLTGEPQRHMAAFVNRARS